MANYEKRIKDGVTTWTPETIAGSQVYDGTPVTTQPAGYTSAQLSTRVGQSWIPSAAKRTYSLPTFGGSKSLYKLSCDFRPAEIDHATWQSMGAGILSQFTSDQRAGTEGNYTYSNLFQDVPDTKKLDYSTESGLNQTKEGHGYWITPLAELENLWMQTIPAWGPGVRWVANLETSNNWERAAYSGGGYVGWGSHWGAWDDVKNIRIKLESNGQEMSLETLFNSGYINIERGVRRQNRRAIMLKVAARNGASVAMGSSLWQGEPTTNALQVGGGFLSDGSINVDHIGGSNGTITLNNRTYTDMTGSHYKFETFHLDYHYYFFVEYNGATINQDLYENPSNPQYAAFHAETSYPVLYGKLTNRHPIAREMGHWLANRKLLMDYHNGQTIPQGRMHEMFYEDNFSRVPHQMNLNPWLDGGQPKLWVIPDTMRTMFMNHYLCEGERDGSFFHIFHAAGSPNQGIVYNLSTLNYHNHELHTLEALFAANRDIQPILDKVANTTLTTDLEVKIGNTGSFQLVNGVSAYGLDPGGAYGAMTPCFMTRHKTTSEGLSVIIWGGMHQDDNTTRTDVIRIPNVGNGNVIEMEYKGRSLQVFECLFPNGASNQVIKAKSIIAAWSKPGYGGIINQ